MAKYLKKIQVLLTEEQLKDLEEIAEAVDLLLSLPEVPAPENWEEFEKELARAHGFHE